MRILGVDPGLNITGYGVLEVSDRGLKLCEAGVVRGTPKASLAQRVGEIHAGLADVVQSLEPDVMALEQLFSHYQRPKTAILMGHARGVICLAAAQVDIPVVHYAATQVKKLLTGNGRAPKSQVAVGDPTRVGPVGTARASRRGRRPGHRDVSLLYPQDLGPGRKCKYAVIGRRH